MPVTVCHTRGGVSMHATRYWVVCESFQARIPRWWQARWGILCGLGTMARDLFAGAPNTLNTSRQHPNVLTESFKAQSKAHQCHCTKPGR